MVEVMSINQSGGITAGDIGGKLIINKNKQKLIVVTMGPGNENFIQMAMDSVKDADEVIYFTSNPLKVASILTDVKVFSNKWDESDKQTNGKARNIYLNYLKANHPNDWCLVIDEDEVVEDLNKIKKYIQSAEPGLYSVKMRHLIGDLGHEDATQKNHWVPNRLFKISEAIKYPLESHPVLLGGKEYKTDCTTIWHLGHLPVDYLKYILKRYNQHINDSIIHTPEFLRNWRNAHLFGAYPNRPINPIDIPKIILNNFGIDFDELYFAPRRTMQANHYQDAIDWKDYFEPLRVVCYGCGFGQRIKALSQIGIPSIGIELSQYVVDNAIPDGLVKQGDITKQSLNNGGLAVAYDLLEHIPYEQIDKAIDNLIKDAEDILVSIPFKGDPNLEADPTHIIKESRDWWIKKFTERGCKLVKTPEHFLFKEQLLIFKGVKNGNK